MKWLRYLKPEIHFRFPYIRFVNLDNGAFFLLFGVEDEDLQDGILEACEIACGEYADHCLDQLKESLEGSYNNDNAHES